MSAAQPMQQATILQYARQLYLPTLGEQAARLAEEAVKKKQSHLSYLEVLLEAEIEERDRKAVTRRIKEAHFPAVKTLEEFDFRSTPHISAAMLRNLSEGGYLTRKEPVIFLGETGTGKTHLATGLAVAACRQRKRVRFTTAAEMVTELIEAQRPDAVDPRTQSLDALRPDRHRRAGIRRHAGRRRGVALPDHRRTRRAGGRDRDHEFTLLRVDHHDPQRTALQGDAGPA